MDDGGRKSPFGLSPDQISRLVALGFEDEDAGAAESPRPEPAGDDPRSTLRAQAGLDAAGERLGQWIGRYRLERVLGEGGMGIVYLAQQEHPIRRPVALKVIKPGMDSQRIIRRFRAEEQTLALLHHPNIAQVLDAGTTDTSRSYFVMEYVTGMPITEYCDRNRLSVVERLSLFQQVCQGVQHAHQKGIIHRDLKPSNILVSVEEETPIPKIIDFGVAKAISQPFSGPTLFTEVRQLLGTPEYMSPEQAEMGDVDIDTRSDIYSLGMLLYVLLTGVLPFDPQAFRRGGLKRIRRIILEKEPRTPSTRLTRLGKEVAEIAHRRRTDVTMLIRRLHSELEWIPLKALRKDRDQRYRSASEMADDISNYLAHRPLIAGPPGVAYRVRKFVRRHRALVGGVAAVLVVSLIGAVISMLFALDAQRARDDAETIAAYLQTDVLGAVSRIPIGEAKVTVLLDMASQGLEGQFQDRPLVEASIRWTLAWTYRELGESQLAEQQLKKAIPLYRQNQGRDHPTTRKVAALLAWIYEDQGRYRDMENLCRRLGNTHQIAVARYHLGQYHTAAASFAALRPTIDPGGHPFATCNLARTYAALGRYDEAEALFVKTLAEWPGGDSHNWHRVYSSALADVYREQGRFEEAERLFSQVLKAQYVDIGFEHVHTLMSTHGLARLYVDQGRLPEAEKLLRKALPTARQCLRENHPLMLRLAHTSAMLDQSRGRHRAVERHLGRVVAAQQAELGPDHPDTLQSKHDLAVSYAAQNRPEEAERLLVEVFEGRRERLGPDHPHTITSLQTLAKLPKSSDRPRRATLHRANLPAEPSGAD